MMNYHPFCSDFDFPVDFICIYGINNYMMDESTNFKGFESRFSFNKGLPNKMVSLQANLLKVWTDKNVQEFYQNAFMGHLDTIPTKQAQAQIIKQIRLTHQNKSPYFQFKLNLEDRNRVLNDLKLRIFKLEDHPGNVTIEQQFQKICEYLSKLREANLFCAEALLKLHKNYNSAHQQSFYQHCRQIFESLHDDCKFLKDSFISEYINFQDGYDPFFLHHYDIMSKAKGSLIQSHPLIEKLFTLNVSYAYRLMKAKNQILEFISSGEMKKLQGDNANVDYANYDPEYHGKREGFSTIIPRESIFDKATPQRRRIIEPMYSEQYEEKKSTSINFRRKNLSLKQAKEKEIGKSPQNRKKQIYNMEKINQISQPQNRYGNRKESSPIIKRQYAQQGSYSYHFNSLKLAPQKKFTFPIETQYEQYHKMVPIQYKIRKRVSHSLQYEDRNYQNTEKDSQNQGSTEQLYPRLKKPEQYETKKQSMNFKERLDPIKQNQNLKSASPSYLPRQNEVQSKIHEPSRIYDPREVQKKRKQERYEPQNQQYYEQPRRPQLQKISLISQTKPMQSNSSPQNSQVYSPQNSQAISPQKSEVYSPQKSPTISSPDKLSSLRLNKVQNIEDYNQSDPSRQKREIKMRSGKLSLKEIFPYLQNLDIDQQYRRKMQGKTWKSYVQQNHCYLNEFIVNNEVAVASICSPMPQGDLIIKYWGKVEQYCDKETSDFLFQKYLDYLEKMTSATEFFYFGQEISQLIPAGFTKKRENVFSKKRVSQIKKKKSEFPSFLSIRCSNITFLQFAPEANILYSDQIEVFTDQNSYCPDYIAGAQKPRIPQSLVNLLSFTQKIDSIPTLNKILGDFELDTYEAGPEIKANNIELIKAVMTSNVDAAFIVGDGYFKFAGRQTHKADKEVICLIPGSSNQIFMYFGKGFKTITEFLKNTNKKSDKNVDFSVKMFNKQLYGRVSNKSLKSMGCYGNWQISLTWQDELQGRIKHPMTNCQHFGPQSFYFAVEMKKQILYSFEVKQQDFLY